MEFPSDQVPAPLRQRVVARIPMYFKYEGRGTPEAGYSTLGAIARGVRTSTLRRFGTMPWSVMPGHIVEFFDSGRNRSVLAVVTGRERLDLSEPGIHERLSRKEQWTPAFLKGYLKPSSEWEQITYQPLVTRAEGRVSPDYLFTEELIDSLANKAYTRTMRQKKTPNLQQQEVTGATGSRGSAALPRRPIEGGDPVALSMKSSNTKSAVTPEAAGELPKYLVEPGNLSKFQREGVIQAPGLEGLPDGAKVIVVSDQDPGRRVLAEVNGGRLKKIKAIQETTSEPVAVQELAKRRPELKQAVASVFPTAALSSVDPGDELFQQGLPKIFTVDDLRGLIQREGLIGKREQLDSDQVLYRLQDYFTQATPAEAVSIMTLRSPETGEIDGYAVFDADKMGSRGVNLSRSEGDGSSTRVSFIDLNDDFVSVVRERRDPNGNTVEVKDAYIPRKKADTMIINYRGKDGFREDADNNATLWEDLEASGVPLQSNEDRSRPELPLPPPDPSTSEESPTQERRPVARRRKPREMPVTPSTPNAPEKVAEAVVQVMTEAAASASPSERPQALRDLSLAIEKLQEITAKTHARRIEGVVNASQAVEKDYADMLVRQQGLQREVEDGLLQQEELRKQIASAVVPDEQKMKANWRLAKRYGLPALAGVLGVAAGGMLFGGGDEVVVVDAGRSGGQQG